MIVFGVAFVLTMVFLYFRNRAANKRRINDYYKDH